MNYQTKMLLTYSIFIIILIVILAFIFFYYSSGVIENNASANLEMVTDKITEQLDNYVNPMDFIMYNLISDSSIKSSMATLEYIDRNKTINNLLVSEAIQTISKALYSDPVNTFHRVCIYNPKGDFFSSYNTKSMDSGFPEQIKKLKWTKAADEAQGSRLVLAPYNDPWGGGNAHVFGIVRSLQGPRGVMGYIEVQNTYADLENIFSVPDERNIGVAAFLDDGETFYAKGIENSKLNEIKKYAVPVKSKTVISEDNEVISIAYSANLGMRVVMVQNKNATNKLLVFIGEMTACISIAVILLSILFIYIFSKRLTKPIRQLKMQIDKTDLANLPGKLKKTESTNEIKVLGEAFQNLKERLSDSIEREIQTQSLHMQASLDLLQAQINPHFIYNVLNVISSKGLESGNEDICEISDNVASMLRYSTSTLQRMATVKQEIEHVESYLFLLKKRYEHYLEYSISVDPKMLSIPSPKIILQPIVENSVTHGYGNSQKDMKIDIKGYISDNKWYLEISDNGKGFDAEVIRDIYRKIDEMKQRLVASHIIKGFEMGGMGILNICARMLLYYKDDFVFSLENNKTNGACVTIGGRIPEIRTEDGNV